MAGGWRGKVGKIVDRGGVIGEEWGKCWEGSLRGRLRENPKGAGIVVLFVGTHERQLDDKGRLALPASFRTHLGEHCYLAFGENNCINVVDSAEFEVMAEQLMARVNRGEVSAQRQRVVSANASLVSFDKQGRVVVDENLRAYAGLRTDSRAMVTGNFTRIEIWSPDQFARVQQAGTHDLAGDLAGDMFAPLIRDDHKPDNHKPDNQKEERGQTTPMASPDQ